MQAFTPQAVFLQGRQCLFTLTVNVTNETPFIPIDTSQLIESAPQPISIDGINLIGTDGEVVTLKGANWFGFEQPVSLACSTCLCTCQAACQQSLSTCAVHGRDQESCTSLLLRWPLKLPTVQATMLDGLFEGDVTITGDYAAVLYRLQLLGFNAVRVPFSFQVGFVALIQPAALSTCNHSCCALCLSKLTYHALMLQALQVLFNTQPVSYTRTCTNSTADDFESNVTPPGVNVAAGASLPVIVSSPSCSRAAVHLG